MIYVKALCLKLIVLQLLKKLPAFYKTFKALYFVHKNPLLNLAISTHILTMCFLNIYFNIMFPFMPTKYYLHSKLPISHFSHEWCTPHASHTALFGQTVLFLNLCLSAVPNRLTIA